MTCLAVLLIVLACAAHGLARYGGISQERGSFIVFVAVALAAILVVGEMLI